MEPTGSAVSNRNCGTRSWQLKEEEKEEICLMPFKSKAQQGFMFANMPKTAKKWAKETPNMKSLPKKVAKKAKRKG
jgi:hypothetical protein